MFRPFEALNNWGMPSETPPPPTWGDLSWEERAIIHAERDGDAEEAARLTIRLLLDKGTDPAEVLKAALKADDPDILRLYVKILADWQNPVPRVPYEHRIAQHIFGKLVLESVIDPTDEQNLDMASATGLPYPVQVISDAILEGLSAFGWRHGISELIDNAQVGELHRRKAQRHADESEDDE